MLQNQQEEAAKKKTTIITTVKDLNNGEPDAKEKAAKARTLATDKGDALKKLRTEVQAEEQRAADLEAQAKAARYIPTPSSWLPIPHCCCFFIL